MNGTVNQDIKVYAGATGRDLHIDAPLTNLSTAYRPVGLIADQIYPVVPVGKQNDNYYTWTKADWLRVPNAARSRGAPSNRIQFSVSSDTYFAKEFSLAMELPIEDVVNADVGLDVLGAGAAFLKDALSLAWEDRLAVTLTTTTNMGSSTSLTNRWSDPIAGTPIDDIYTGFESIRLTTGQVPTVMIFSGIAWNNFRKHPDVVSFVRGAGDNRGGGPVTQEQVAAAFGTRAVLIGAGVKNSASENAPASFIDIWSTSCILLHVAAAPGRMVPSHGYTFQWRVPGAPAPMVVDRYSIRDRRVEVLETCHYQDEKVTGTDLGYMIVNC